MKAKWTWVTSYSLSHLHNEMEIIITLNSVINNNARCHFNISWPFFCYSSIMTRLIRLLVWAHNIAKS